MNDDEVKMESTHTLKWISFACFAFVILGLSSCYSDIFEPEPIVIDPVDTISFSTQIVPLFESGCNLSICHATGGAFPDLTPANAYNSLIDNGFVDTNDPTKSELYFWLIGDEGRDIMPPQGRDEELIELVLGWMSQGALNN